MAPLIPIYDSDGNLHTWASQERLAELQSRGLLSDIVRRRNGTVVRASLLFRPGTFSANRYSYRQHLGHGVAWELRHLGGNSTGSTYAPPETRADFFAVVNSCTAPPPASAEQAATSSRAGDR